MKIVFTGTPEFAVPTLTGLIAHHDVILVVTQPDRPKGRGKKLSESPVKVCAKEHNITVIQPESLKKNDEVYNIIKKADPDVIVVTAYGNILPKEILELPQYGCINVHASLLPRYRGAAPINWAIINGENITGITIMKMNQRPDAGDIILSKEVEICEKDNALTLTDKLSRIGADALLKALDMIKNNAAVFKMQDESQATYAPMLTKKIGHINWNRSMKEIINLVRGTWPWPGAYFLLNGKMIKVIECSKNKDLKGNPGEVLEANREGLYVGCNDGSIMITVLQPEGKRAMNVDEYLRGNKLERGTILE
ncbi:MAG: methionyl-tRNA formyltransferase [Thermoanaerobacteraceae bacterium]|nr:methionyl-tRNA formyltransferase [Thermoanaerobacteraceae bacterium]